MTSNERALVEYWIEIGKLQKEVYDIHDPAQGYRYYFLNTDIQLELQDTWKHFFKCMNTFNHLYFLSGIEGAEVLSDNVDMQNKISPFDPWLDTSFISIVIPFSSFEFQGKNVQYRCIEVLK